MSSGDKRVQINTRERAVSEDINRAQAFKAQQLSRLWQYLIGFRAGILFDAGPALVTDFADTTVQSDDISGGDVFGGLLVRPDAGSYLTIDPGFAGFWVHDYSSNPDDGNYVLVASTGVTDITALPFVPNPGPGPRWDLVSAVPRDSETVLEQSNRDVFDTVSGLFTASTVDKVIAQELDFVYTQGTANTAAVPFPPTKTTPFNTVHAPLVVVFVPAGAASFDDCDFYDVRNLVRNRESDCNPWFTVSRRGVTNIEKRINATYEVNSADDEVTGINWGRAVIGGVGPYPLGGVLKKNVPASSSSKFGDASDGSGQPADVGGEYLNLVVNDPDLFMTGAAAPQQATGDYACLVLTLPRPYNRFVRYTQTPNSNRPLRFAEAGTGRVPEGANGVWLVCDQGVMPTSGIHLAGSTVPDHFGANKTGDWAHFWVTTMVCSNSINGSPQVTPTRVTGRHHVLWWEARSAPTAPLVTYQGATVTQYASSGTQPTLPETNGEAAFVWQLNPTASNAPTGGASPRRARKIKARVTITITGASNFSGDVQVSLYSSTSFPYGPGLNENIGAKYPALLVRSVEGGGTTVWSFTANEVEIELPRVDQTYEAAGFGPYFVTLTHDNGNISDIQSVVASGLQTFEFWE